MILAEGYNFGAYGLPLNGLVAFMGMRKSQREQIWKPGMFRIFFPWFTMTWDYSVNVVSNKIESRYAQSPCSISLLVFSALIHCFQKTRHILPLSSMHYKGAEVVQDQAKALSLFREE